MVIYAIYNADIVFFKGIFGWLMLTSCHVCSGPYTSTHTLFTKYFKNLSTRKKAKLSQYPTGFLFQCLYGKSFLSKCQNSLSYRNPAYSFNSHVHPPIVYHGTSPLRYHGNLGSWNTSRTTFAAKSRTIIMKWQAGCGLGPNTMPVLSRPD